MKLPIFKLVALSLLFSSIIVSCQKVDLDTDIQLIEAIEAAANKTVVEVSDLPTAAQTIMNEFYSESFTDEALMAEDIGFQVDMVRDRGSRIGQQDRLYFDQRGRQLRRDRTERVTDRNVTDGRQKRDCFSIVYPITLIMPDGTTITGNSANDLADKIRRWYHSNPRFDARPQIQYPITVEFPASDRVGATATTIVVNNETEMERVRARCD